MTEVRLHGVSKTYSDQRRGVVDLNWRLKSGGLTVLVGASGSGKTTTLRTIAGLEAVTTGEIFLGEQNVTHWAAHQRQVAYVPQSPGLFPQWTVRQNLAGMTFGQAGASGSQQGKSNRLSLQTVAAMLEIEELLDRFPGEISGGEQQRVSLARALLRPANLMLLDEPFGHLDGWLRQQIRRHFRELQRESGVTTLLVTHYPAEALAMADELAVMDNGRLLQVGSAWEVYRNPQHLRVVRLLGEDRLNLWSGRLQRDDAGWSWQDEQGAISLPAEVVPGEASEREVWLAMYAEGFSRDGSGIPFAEGKIAHQGEFLGSYWLTPVSCSMAGRERIVWVTQNSGSACSWKIGQQVQLSATAENWMWFDKQTGIRLGGRVPEN